MSDTVRDLLRSIVISIGMAMAIFCLVGIVFDISYGGNFSMEGYRFTKMVIGCIIIGLGFGIPSMIYKNENLPMHVRVLVHMGIGCVIYTIVAYSVGWMGGGATMTQGIIIAAIQLFIAFIIWFLFMRYYRKEAQTLNECIQGMKQ